jgi:hypothetical protein
MTRYRRDTLPLTRGTLRVALVAGLIILIIGSLLAFFFGSKPLSPKDGLSPFDSGWSAAAVAGSPQASFTLNIYFLASAPDSPPFADPADRTALGDLINTENLRLGLYPLAGPDPASQRAAAAYACAASVNLLWTFHWNMVANAAALRDNGEQTGDLAAVALRSGIPADVFARCPTSLGLSSSGTDSPSAVLVGRTAGAGFPSFHYAAGKTLLDRVRAALAGS